MCSCVRVCAVGCVCYVIMWPVVCSFCLIDVLCCLLRVWCVCVCCLFVARVACGCVWLVVVCVSVCGCLV